MPIHRFFRITDQDIDALSARTRDEGLIEAFCRWMERLPEIDERIQQITEAFAGVQLGDSVGLKEANGLDDYAMAAELVELRSQDEREDWRRIDVETLNECYPAPSYMDSRGFVFHLPAFLIAELNDEFGFGFIDRLIVSDRSPAGWQELLTTAQCEAIAATLELVSEHPEYAGRLPEFDTAIQQLRGPRKQEQET